MLLIRLLLAVLIVVVAVTPAVSAEGADSLSGGLGLSAGVVGGFGFCLRKIPTEGIGFHTALLYFKEGDDHFFNIAFEPIYVIHRGRSTSFYAIGGISYTAEKSSDEDSDEGSDGGWDGKFAGGVGIGFGWRILGQFWTSMELVVTASEDDFYPLPQVTVYYLFW